MSYREGVVARGSASRIIANRFEPSVFKDITLRLLQSFRIHRRSLYRLESGFKNSRYMNSSNRNGVNLSRVYAHRVLTTLERRTRCECRMKFVQELVKDRKCKTPEKNPKMSIYKNIRNMQNISGYIFINRYIRINIGVLVRICQYFALS